MAAESRERAIAIAIRRSNGENLLKFVVRDGHGDRAAPSGCVLDAAEADVEIAALDGLIELGEGGLHEDGRPAELAGDELGDLDVEADDLRRMSRIRFDERGAAFGIAAPAQRRLRMGERRPRD